MDRRSFLALLGSTALAGALPLPLPIPAPRRLQSVGNNLNTWGDFIPFTPDVPAHHEAVLKALTAGCKRVVFLKSRQCGVSTFLGVYAPDIARDLAGTARQRWKHEHRIARMKAKGRDIVEVEHQLGSVEGMRFIGGA